MTALTLPPPVHVDLLILGAGWTSTFLLPQLDSHHISHAATTRAGSPTTIPWTFDPATTDPAAYARLPSATTVLITFPITAEGGTKRLVDLYTLTHAPAHFIQLGTTSVWDAHGVSNRHTPVSTDHPRGREEAALLAAGGCVLNLSGLWGGVRSPKSWVGRVADTKEKLKGKESLHLVHGEDVARAVVAVHLAWEKAEGQRWLLTDMRSYDWWDLALGWGGVAAGWALELMKEAGEGVLPRGLEKRGRALDSREFWSVFGIRPERSLLM